MLSFKKVFVFANSLVCVLFWCFYLGQKFLFMSSVVVEFEVLRGTPLLVSVPIMMDTLSMSFCCVVLLISSCVMLYSGFYMSDEQYYNRFCKLVLLFVASMLALTLIPNLIGLMIGWDGLGLSSYLLVVYYQDKRSLGAGTLTVLSNRIGDVMFFMGISLVSGISAWNFVDMQDMSYMTVLVGIIIVGCMTKSAQMPFSAWLPAAMSAPTPVSALVHSSTLVTAGIYVLVRFSVHIDGVWFLILSSVASLTMISSSVSAFYELDMKKVVALSTLSQLSVMLLSLGVGAYSICMFHLLSHALFKALMFLCVGSVIHVSGIQDIRYVGGVGKISPIVAAWLFVALFSLMGLPFLAGFYSKDMVLAAYLSGLCNPLQLVLVCISTCLSVMYSFWLLACIYPARMYMSYMWGLGNDLYTSVACSVLGLGALFGGVIMQSVILSFSDECSVDTQLKLMPFVCFMLGLLAMMYIITSSLEELFSVNKFSELSKDSSTQAYYDSWATLWFLPYLSAGLYINSVMSSSASLKSDVEDGYMENSFGSEGIWAVSKIVSSQFMHIQRDQLSNRMGTAFIKGVVFMMVIFLLGYMM
uniref:NADH-ubiquinone oxidoreductase chain 5 n=1 Tax=Nuttallia olivacea TaxID=1125678 RepID=I6NIM5_9BIVA|nr:NADH dehydrogenase subunit 5 [Nuttallia olivacea]AEV94296.1 NADH dehydrogenase subunit 5 [Nuttallia olivacea]